MNPDRNIIQARETGASWVKLNGDGTANVHVIQPPESFTLLNVPVQKAEHTDTIKDLNSRLSEKDEQLMEQDQRITQLREQICYLHGTEGAYDSDREESAESTGA